MSKFVILVALLSALVSISSATNVVCYFMRWTIYREGDGEFDATLVDPNLCTHIVYSWIGLYEDGTVNILDNYEAETLHGLEDIRALKEQNPDLKVLASMGGWEEGSATYSLVAADPELRSTLVQSVLDFLKEHEFDGFDLFWQYPGQRDGDPDNDRANFVLLLKDLYSALSAEGLVLSIAAAPGIWAVPISYDIEGINENVDMINLMTFDLHGVWEDVAGHHSPLFASSLDNDAVNTDASVKYWINQGADRSKINVGLSTAGRSYTLLYTSEVDLYAPINGSGEPGPLTDQAGNLGYNEICAYDSDWAYVWDDEQLVPHKYSGNQWVGYDDVYSFKVKAKYVTSNELGGVMFYALDTDDFLGICGDGPYPLLNAVNEVLLEGKLKRNS